MRESQPIEKDQIIDICPGRTGLQQITQRFKEGIRIISGQVVVCPQPKRLGPASRFTCHYRARGIGGTIIAVGGESDQHYIL